MQQFFLIFTRIAIIFLVVVIVLFVVFLNEKVEFTHTVCSVVLVKALNVNGVVVVIAVVGYICATK